MQRLADFAISPVYQGKMSNDILEIEVPKEKFANCLDCHFCADANHYRSETKCCDYHPIIPNYMVGAILADETTANAEGRKRALEKIQNKVGITPYGIIPPKNYSHLFKKTRDHFKKGHDDISKEIINQLKCPFSQKGLCTVYSYRGELCPSFHCTSVSGNFGRQFWKTQNKYLSHVERLCAIYFLKKANYPVDKLILKRINPIELKLENDKGELNQLKYDRIWKPIVESPESFYLSCFEMFLSLDQSTFESIIGFEGRILQDQMISQSVAFRNKTIPNFLKYIPGNEFKVQKLFSDAALLDYLKGFDGKKSTNELVRISLMEGTKYHQNIQLMIMNNILQEV